MILSGDDVNLMLHALERARLGALEGRDAAALLFGEDGARLWNKVLADVRYVEAVIQRGAE